MFDKIIYTMSGLCVLMGQISCKNTRKKRHSFKSLKDSVRESNGRKRVPWFTGKTMFCFISLKTDRGDHTGWFSWVDSSRKHNKSSVKNVAFSDKLHRNKVECTIFVRYNYHEFFLFFKLFYYIWKFVILFIGLQISRLFHAYVVWIDMFYLIAIFLNKYFIG